MTTPSSSSEHSENLYATGGVPHPAGFGAQGDGQQDTTAVDDEEERKRIRRERNRIAAARCRDRRREKTATLVQETEELENKNDDIRKDIEVLESQRKKLEEILTNHLPSCTGLGPSDNTEKQATTS
ncbi:uncharacterized protein [Amphiura filiformis]|uniref:uncharacterized protein n=1 Tax=Amphiura filiformis TaxID=82378 RepID=UPI003B210B0F